MGQLHTGTGINGSLEKVQFARIHNKVLVYDSEEDDSTVYPGLHCYKYRYHCIAG